MRWTCAAAWMMALAAPAGGAQAVPTKTTTFVAPLPGTTLAQQPDLAGVVEHDEWVPIKIADPYGGPPTIGRVQVRVVRVKAGTLDFYWRIRLDPGAGKAPISSLYITGWPAAVYDANWRIDGLGSIAPSDIYIDLPTAQKPDPLIFALGMKPGQESRFMFLRTKATKSKAAVGFIGHKKLGGANFPMLGPAN